MCRHAGILLFALIVVNITRDNQLVVMSQVVAASPLKICIENDLNKRMQRHSDLKTATNLVAEKHATILWL